MAQYVGVSFKRHGQIYFFTTSPFVLNMRDRVLVKTEEGIGFGEVMSLRDTLPEGLDAGTLKPIYRPATQEDLAGFFLAALRCDPDGKTIQIANRSIRRPTFRYGKSNPSRSDISERSLPKIRFVDIGRRRI